MTTLLHRRTYNNIVDTVFNTPLVKLNKVIPAGHAAVYAKCEFFNPMASVKDRIGRAMIEAAEKDGIINAIRSEVKSRGIVDTSLNCWKCVVISSS